MSLVNRSFVFTIYDVTNWITLIISDTLVNYQYSKCVAFFFNNSYVSIVFSILFFDKNIYISNVTVRV